jgi:uncharacterized protein
MKIEPLSLSHMPILRPKLQALGLFLSEYSFANLFLFRKKHTYEVLYGREIYIRGLSYDGKKYIMPTSQPDIATLEKDDIFSQCEMIFPLSQTWALAFNSSQYMCQYKEEDSDYLYLTEKLASFAGRHLSKKRNLVKQFREMYEATYHLLSSKTVDDAMRVLEMWQEKSSKEIQDADYYQCQEAIQMHSELDLFGVIYYIEGAAKGIMIGEKSHDEMVTLHFAKADVTYKGIYQFMYQDFASKLLQYRYFNMEQDLGIKELRQTKNSYMPVQYCEKYRVSKIT